MLKLSTTPFCGDGLVINTVYKVHPAVQNKAAGKGPWSWLQFWQFSPETYMMKPMLRLANTSLLHGTVLFVGDKQHARECCKTKQQITRKLKTNVERTNSLCVCLDGQGTIPWFLVLFQPEARVQLPVFTRQLRWFYAVNLTGECVKGHNPEVEFVNRATVTFCVGQSRCSSDAVTVGSHAGFRIVLNDTEGTSVG